MDAKDLRTESAVSERNNDGSKYSQSGGIALHCDRNKSYQDIGSNSLGKVDVANVRPCAVIGPDRIVPPPAPSDAYHLKKATAEPWQCMDNTYRRPPEYPHKLTSFQNPTRNISPRQTFQENMQRIMVPPTYNSNKINDDTSNYAQMSDRSNGLSKNIKLSVPPEAKFCDVPYAVNPINNEQKTIRNPEMCLPSVNPTLTRTAPHGWPPGSVNLRSTRMYGAPELYQYQDYPSCAGPRPVVPRPHRTVPEEQGYVYADHYYQDGNIRFKPYPSVKERYPQQRYEYIGNYSNPFHPPPGFPPHKYELQKSMPPHPYPPYPPIKYLDSRVSEPVMEGYQRNPQGNYNTIPYRNQVIHPNYGPVIGNCPQSKMHSYPPDAHIKTVAPNKLPYDNNTKAYIEYENNRPKMYPPSESYFVNEMARMPMKSQVIMPNYPAINMHNIQPNPYYKKDHQQMKNYEHMAHFRNMDPNVNVHNLMSRHPPVFSPNTIAISPTDSSTSNDTSQTIGTSQEDFGYVSQSSTASVRSMDSGINRIPIDCLRKYYDNRYGPVVRTSHMMSKSQLNSNNNVSKKKKNIDVRQFFQMWNEGDEEAEENSSKEIIIQTGSSDKNHFSKTHETMNNQEQLYVLGLVNVPSEELAKYEHIQKVSKLPENIKGYNSIELLNQFEEVIESSNMNNYKSPTPKEFHMSMKGVVTKQVTGIIPPRPVSPLDVEAKISQSVIHKEVGCNFEIKPCSPKMLNVEVAAPVQNMLAERSIEKVTNPVMIKSPMLNGMDDNIDCNIMKRTDHRLNINENVRIPSCKMLNTQFSNNNSIDPIKNSYSLQDLESNSGLCLASLPRLDNDIELNFPEVNQQFINANKGDSTVLITTLRDLPTLDVLDQSDNQTKDEFDSINTSRQEKDVIKSPYMVESEKEFPKLSKYRKTKTTPIESKENKKYNINAVRTDSVIIKNPENIKNYEDSYFSPNSLSNAVVDIQQAPINLTSQGNSSTHAETELKINNLNDSAEDKELPVEIAIDFSLNKSFILDNTEITETRVESVVENPIDVEKSPSNTAINSDNSPRLSVFVDANKNSINNLKENKITSFEKDNEYDCEPILVTKPGKIIENSDFNEISHHNEMYPDSDNEPNGSYKFESVVNTTEKISLDLCNKSLSSTTTETHSNDFLSDINNDDCLMEIDNHTEKATDVLPEVKNCNLINIDSPISQNHKDFRENFNKQEATNENFTNIATTEEPFDYCNKPNSSAATSVNDFTDEVTETKLNKDTINLNNCNKVNVSDVTKEIQPRKRGCNSFVLPYKEIKLNANQNYCDRSVCPLSPSVLNSETHPCSEDLKNNDIKREHSLDKISHKDELKNFDYNNCKDTPKMHNEESDKITMITLSNDNVKKQCEIGRIPNSWYGSKGMYSPWIQNLITYTEGNIKDITPTENCSNEFSSPDKSVVLHTATKNEILNDDNCLLPVKSPEERVSCRSVEDEIIKEIAIETDQEIVATNVCNISEKNIKESLTTYSNLLSNKSLELDGNNICNIENEPAMEVDNNITVSNKLDKLNELPKSYESYQTSVSECNKNENLLINFNASTASAIVHEETGKNEDALASLDTLTTSLVVNENHDKNKDVLIDSDSYSASSKVNKVPNRKKDGLIDFDASTASPIIREEPDINEDKLINFDSSTESPIVHEKPNTNVDEVINFDGSYASPIVHEEPDRNIDEVINDDASTTITHEEPKINENELIHFNASTASTIMHEEPDRNADEVINFDTSTASSIIHKKPDVNDDDLMNLDASTASPIMHKESDKDIDEVINFDTSTASPVIHKKPDVNDDELINFDVSTASPIMLKESNRNVDKVVNFDASTASPIIYKKPDVNNDELISFDASPASLIVPKESDRNLDEVINFDASYASPIKHEEPDTSVDEEINYDASTASPIIHKDINEDELIHFNASTAPSTIYKNHLRNEDILGNFDTSTASPIVDEEVDRNEDDPIITDNSLNTLTASPKLNEELNKNEDILTSFDSYIESPKVNEETKDNISNFDTSTEIVNEFSDNENKCEETNIPNYQNTFSESIQKQAKQFDDKNISENIRYSCNKMQMNNVPFKKSQPLKRSLSDSALNRYNKDERPKQENEENLQFIWPFKRRKVNNVENENDILAQNLCNIINNRRNSISSFYNEENVSFCILIDNSCIITEEENDDEETTNDQEKMCYTELSEECIAEIQNSCRKTAENIETLTEVTSSPRQENACDYSDSFVLEEKTYEESWVDDIACVETVISDDIAEDIEISGPSSPKDDVGSDNDESGVFSSSEHTDKVKFIYGDKMCSDDAQFVETLYNTPQMDVNKTLFSRETKVSEEYNEYYDNDSLEKMLSESNDHNLSRYVPEYMDTMFPTGVVNSIETPENKENISGGTFPIFQAKGIALDKVVDINIEKIEHENMYPGELFSKSQDDIVHSCESSVDNVFTYKQKDEGSVYTTSSSPEVSSTTSEEKNSGILLKITNYKGSRISQINDISTVNKRSSCKFTEDKDYLQSNSNFPTNRPLLTKAAQKYIPPLKESIRDLKVKLSLPQHSLMKLKQLKISKDEPKVNKQNANIPAIPKKPKPKFEDVLKSIDEIQIKMHKEKTKKSKKSIPKVVIKKSLNGSHYASTSNKEDFNPDLTGRKWQPWVFIEKNHFVDKMAIKKKTKAIYSHRKRTYVLAEKFQKYKSVSSANFVISPPISDSSSSTGLKYTIRLKHTY